MRKQRPRRRHVSGKAPWAPARRAVMLDSCTNRPRETREAGPRFSGTTLTCGRECLTVEARCPPCRHAHWLRLLFLVRSLSVAAAVARRQTKTSALRAPTRVRGARAAPRGATPGPRVTWAVRRAPARRRARSPARERLVARVAVEVPRA